METIKNAGAKLANIAFNLAQRKDLPADIIACLDATRKEWDAAVRLASQAQAAPVGAADDVDIERQIIALEKRSDEAYGVQPDGRMVGDIDFGALADVAADSMALLRSTALAQRAGSVGAKEVHFYRTNGTNEQWHETSAENIEAIKAASLTWHCEYRTLYTAPDAAKIAPPSFSTDPDGDLSIDWVVGDSWLSVSFSKTGVVSWATGIEGASACGSQQVALDRGRTVTCQIYGHVVGHCGECNVGDEAAADVADTNKVLADNYMRDTCGTKQDSGRDAALGLFRHVGGKLYSKLGPVKAKVGDTGWWQAIRYRSVENGQEYVTDAQRWSSSFTEIAAMAAQPKKDN